MGWQRTDDLDGSPAEQHVFGLDGKLYTIDLGEANAAKLRKALQPFLTVAQVFSEMPAPEPSEPLQTPLVRARGPRGKQSIAVAQSTIRQWANENGYQVAPKGRIPDAVMSAYTLAHP